MTAIPTIKTASSVSEESAIIDVLVRAFTLDPAVRWLWPDKQQYFMHFPNFVRAFGGKAFKEGSAHYAENYTGAALWLPPSVYPDLDILNTLLQSTVSEQIKNDVFAVFEQMGGYHPSEPHWYLPLMGVDPSYQGRGIGSALMQHGLVQCDRDGKLAYLESSNSKNISLYKRHGFELLGTIQAGVSPSLFPMIRRPNICSNGAYV